MRHFPPRSSPVPAADEPGLDRRVVDQAEPSESTAGPGSDLFREEALREHLKSRNEGDILRISPRWTHAVYWVLLLVVFGTLAYAVLGRMHEYASGPAIVLRADQTELTALAAGTVESVDVLPGDRVGDGQVLVRFHAESERSMLERQQVEFDLELVRLLRDPEDEGARAALAKLRAQMRLAEARLQERVVRAPHAGSVHDVRIRPGQRLGAGEPVLSLVTSDRQHQLIAFVPGQYRPLLESGQPLRLEVTGYSHAYVDLVVRRVGDEVIGPTAVRRILSPEVGDAIAIAGPVVVVRADLPEPTFSAGGEEHPYYGGMHGVAEVRVRDERILVTLIPGLKALVEKFRD
ncbi:MAG: HlyD family efflux transporter periplasmic adaptor subunit [Candidatus Krumholzibacteriia bacterium]